ncbi:MAG: metallophosphoesterase [Firmicutes bacterium]|nr:metallophosphoesterase [Bacillota bacterium]
MGKEFLIGFTTALLVVLFAATLAVGFFWHQQTLQIVRLSLSVDGLPPAWDGVRIGLISDLHIGTYMNASRVQRVVRRLNAQRPDFIVIAGDTVDVRVTEAQEAEPALRALYELEAPYGVYLVFGNHDTPRAHLWRPLIQQGGIRILENEHVALQKGDDTLYLVGLADALYGRIDLRRSWQGIPEDACVILAVHEPDVADEFADWPVALQLSGHSHGGQIVLPFSRPRYLPPLAHKYYSGLYTSEAGHPVYTTRGVGTSQVPFRFLARPEITIITLRDSEAC